MSLYAVSVCHYTLCQCVIIRCASVSLYAVSVCHYTLCQCVIIRCVSVSLYAVSVCHYTLSRCSYTGSLACLSAVSCKVCGVFQGQRQSVRDDGPVNASHHLCEYTEARVIAADDPRHRS